MYVLRSIHSTVRLSLDRMQEDHTECCSCSLTVFLKYTFSFQKEKQKTSFTVVFLYFFFLNLYLTISQLHVSITASCDRH